MDALLDPGSSVVEFACPRCGHQAVDEWETIADRHPASWRCNACLSGFSVLIVECQHCAAETSDVALCEAELEPASRLRCRSCSHLCLHDEVQAKSADAA